MASIYDLTDEFRTLWALMEAGQLDDEALAGAFECTKEELALKLEGYCKFIKNLESDMVGLKAEEDRLRAKRDVIKNTIDRSKEAMKQAMVAAGENNLPCGTFKVSVANNPPKVIMDDSSLTAIPKRYIVPMDPTIDLAAIKETLKNGSAAEKAELEGVAHLEQGTHVNIR